MQARTRSRIITSQPILHTGYQYVGKRKGYPDNVINYPATGEVLQNCDEVEYISDETQRAPFKVGECDHWKQKCIFLYAGDHTGESSNISPKVTHIVTGHNAFWKTVYSTRDNPLVHSPTTVSPKFPTTTDTQLLRTIEKFYHINEVDMLLNFAEAGQTVDLVKQMLSKDTVNKARQFFKLSGLKRAKILANANLAYSFGIAPLIGDMNTLWNNVGNIRKQFKQYQRQLSKPIRISSSQNGTLYLSNGTTTDSRTFLRHVLVTNSCKETVVVSGTRTSPYDSEVGQFLDFAWQKFGSVGPASFVFERIPFSFIAEWFLELGGALGALDNLLTGSYKRINRISRSVVSDYQINCYPNRTSADFTDIAPGPNQVVAVQHVHRYSRSRQRPTWVSWSGRFGKKQFGLLVSLLTQLYR